MSALWNLFMQPLAVPFRLAAAQPWPAIVISGVLSALAYYTGHDVIGFILVSYMSYVMIWLDETRHPRIHPDDVGNAAAAE